MHALLVAAQSVAQLLGVAGVDPLEFTVVTVAFEGAPRRLDAADLDGDGDIDLFVVGRGAGGTALRQVFLNEAGGFVPGWSLTQITSSAAEIWDADLADTDNDGDPDVVTIVPYGKPQHRYNDGQGNFDTVSGVPTASYRFEHEFADMNSDGNVDLIYYEPDDFNDSYFGTMKGFGNGSFGWDFTAELMFIANVESQRRIALGDLTGDGLRDAAFTSLVSGLRFIEGKPNAPGSTLPSWQPAEVIDVTPCADAVMTDLAGNPGPDLLATLPNRDAVVVHHVKTSGEFARRRQFRAGEAPDAITAADLDLDGATDVIVTNPTSGSVHVLRGLLNGGLDNPQELPVGEGPRDVVAADLDGDGDIDLAVPCAAAGHVAVLLNSTL